MFSGASLITPVFCFLTFAQGLGPEPPAVDDHPVKPVLRTKIRSQGSSAAPALPALKLGLPPASRAAPLVTISPLPHQAPPLAAQEVVQGKSTVAAGAPALQADISESAVDIGNLVAPVPSIPGHDVVLLNPFEASEKASSEETGAAEDAQMQPGVNPFEEPALPASPVFGAAVGAPPPHIGGIDLTLTESLETSGDGDASPEPAFNPFESLEEPAPVELMTRSFGSAMLTCPEQPFGVADGDGDDFLAGDVDDTFIGAFEEGPVDVEGSGKLVEAAVAAEIGVPAMDASVPSAGEAAGPDNEAPLEAPVESEEGSDGFNPFESEADDDATGVSAAVNGLLLEEEIAGVNQFEEDGVEGTIRMEGNANSDDDGFDAFIGHDDSGQVAHEGKESGDFNPFAAPEATSERMESDDSNPFATVEASEVPVVQEAADVSTLRNGPDQSTGINEVDNDWSNPFEAGGEPAPTDNGAATALPTAPAVADEQDVVPNGVAHDEAAAAREVTVKKDDDGWGDDDFADFCEAPAEVAQGATEGVGAGSGEGGSLTTEDKVQQLVDRLPDLSFMLSDSLVKPS